MSSRWLLVVSAVVFASGCRVGVDLPVVTLPPTVAQTLSQGLPLQLVNPLIPSTVKDDNPNRVVFQHEWRDAPSMTTISLGLATTEQADIWARSVGVAPLETDLAVCDSRVIAGVQEQLPPNADGKWNSVPLPVLGGDLVMNRIKGELASISIVPMNGSGSTLGRTFTVTAVVTGLSVGLGLRNQGSLSAPDGYFINVPRVTIVCNAQIVTAVDASLNPTPCGEQFISCLQGETAVMVENPDFPAHPVVSNLPTTISWLLQPAMDLVGVPSLIGILEKGILLHFEHFAATGLGFDSNGALLLTGSPSVAEDGTSFCSPNALVPPQIPPTRGLVQTHAYDGHGEVRSRDGFVKTFTLRPYMAASFTDARTTVTKDLLLNTRLQPNEAVMSRYGKQLSPIGQFDVSYLTTVLRADRLNSTCWTRDTSVRDFSLVLPRLAFVLFEGQLRRPAEVEKFASRKFRFAKVARAEPGEVRKAMGRLGLSCGECTGYWRMDGVLGAPDFPTTWPIPDDDSPFDFDVPPYLGQWWFEQNPTEWINSLTACDRNIHVANDEVVTVLPEVRLFDTMFDSSRVNSMGYAARGNTAKATEATFTYQGNTHRRIILQKDCWADPRAACWSSQLPAPARFTVGAASGASGTTIPRAGVRQTVRANNVAAYGAGAAIPWGFFDRSMLDLYSSVPQEYRDANVTTSSWDWRGNVRVDWRHDPATFRAPADLDSNAIGAGLKHEGVSDWWGTKTHILRPDDLIPYRPDFSKDQLMVRRRIATDRSFCISEDALTATIDEVEVKSVNPSVSVKVPANRIFAPNGTGQVQVTGSGYSTGPASALVAP